MQLNLQRSEVEATAWISQDHARRILNCDDTLRDVEPENCITIDRQNNQVPGGVTMKSLFPKYPNEEGEGLVGAAIQVLKMLLPNGQQQQE